ncbi:MAG: rRNA adenine N-6-methyltransferase family protein [Candidatus Nanoarchaeia archaeon]|nr:rRNA adenine N-6-methyltransferase family protein [Candidatus Nanoarchaeia archaeon]
MKVKKIIARKEKKQFIEDIKREVSIAKKRVYYIDDVNKDFDIKEGVISKKDLKKKDGSIIKTNQNKEFVIFSPSFIDQYKKIKRTAQIITTKDAAAIIAETGINKNSTVVDAGAGSGALSCFLANYAKKVYSYELRDDFIEVVSKNIKMLELKNITIKKKDIYNGIDKKNIDLITLDLPEPWKVIEHAEKSLNIGGFIVSYSTSIPQTADFVNNIRKNERFIFIKTIELIEREWKIDGRRIRPKSEGLGYTGFISFARKIK